MIEASDFDAGCGRYLFGLPMAEFMEECNPATAEAVRPFLPPGHEDMMVSDVLIHLYSRGLGTSLTQLLTAAQQWYYAVVICGSQRICN